MRNLIKPMVTPLMDFKDCNKHNTVFLKDETKQYTNAFKYRGVYNKFLVTDFKHFNGIVTASTGNHAQAVAFCACQMDMKCVVFVPNSTPYTKIKRIKQFEAIIYQNRNSDNYDDCVTEAEKYAQKENYLYIPSFDDIDIIHGHRSLIDEISVKKIDYIFSPIGGGGLLSSLLLASRSTVIGVELQSNDAMRQSLIRNTNTKIELSTCNHNSFCEGLLVSRVGDIPFSIAQKHTLRIVTVTESDIKEAIIRLSKIGIKSEGAGAASYAAYLKSNIINSNVLCIVSGGNIDDNVYEDIISKG